MQCVSVIGNRFKYRTMYRISNTGHVQDLLPPPITLAFENRIKCAYSLKKLLRFAGSLFFLNLNKNVTSHLITTFTIHALHLFTKFRSNNHFQSYSDITRVGMIKTRCLIQNVLNLF